jgi:thioredoxin reductase (NADPH)
MTDYAVTRIDVDASHPPEFWDVVIIGAGPAGLAAALTTAHRGLTTLVIEAKDTAGGQPRFLYAEKRIVDIPGFPDGITGEELSARVHRQAIEANVQFRFAEELVTIEDTDRVEKEDPLKRVVTSKGSHLCRKVLLACGLLHVPRKMPVLDALDSRNVHYRVPKIGDYEGQVVAVVGGGDSALDAALMVLGRHGRAHILVRKDVPAGKTDTLARIEKAGGVLHTGCEITAASFSGNAIALQLSKGEELLVDKVIVQIGFLSARDTFARLGVRQKADGSVVVDPYFESSRRGIFAVGDVHGDIKLITVAWAEGIQAAIYAFREITSPYWLSERRLADHKLSLMGDKMTEAAMTPARRPER